MHLKINTLTLFFILTAISLTVMSVIDYILGAKAEFLNAYSVFERLTGHSPSAGTSWVAQEYGAMGELFCVLLANVIIGGILTFFARMIFKN